jgi:hypothetical protein
MIEPQKGIPQCGSPAGTGGSGTKNSECGTGRESRKESAFPQISYSSHYLQVLTKNFDLNLTQILEVKSIEYLKTNI